MKKLSIGEVLEELCKVQRLADDIFLATADFGVEEAGKPKHVTYRQKDIDVLDSVAKDTRNTIQKIRKRCISGFSGRGDNQILSKFGQERKTKTDP